MQNISLTYTRIKMSKGSDYRPYNKDKFNKEFERIFKKKEPKKKDEKK